MTLKKQYKRCVFEEEERIADIREQATFERGLNMEVSTDPYPRVENHETAARLRKFLED